MTDFQQAPENYELLSTKLVVPHSRASSVTRKRLLSRLDEGLDRKLTLVSAPAGFGKTTLVAEWAESLKSGDGSAQEPHSNLPPSNIQFTPHVAWVSLDPGDNDPVRFWRYVLTAYQNISPELSESALALLNNSPSPPFEVLLTMFINKATQLTEEVVLVLEDYQLITCTEIHEILAFFIDHLPERLHMILVTRRDPPLPLARLRAHNELNELRATDLRFTPQETQDFLKLAVPVPLTQEVVTRVTERTEGWIAGLHLVTLALQRLEEPPEIEAYLSSFTGSHQPILDYLVADVFNAQPEAIQMFLLQTSSLGRLAAPLCNAVTGREDSAIILEQLERTNLFLNPLDESGQWYRYHALFSEAMQHFARQQLGKAQLCELDGKASLWYEGHGMLAEAVESSLSAQDYHRAAGLIERVIAPRMVQNEHQTLRRWMEQLPEGALQAHPEICMTFATAILFTSDRHSPDTKARLQTPVQIAEGHWHREENDHKLGEVYAFHSLVNWLQRDFKASFSYARKAQSLLPESERQWRGISLIMLGVDELMDGRLNTARQTLTEALAHCEASENIYGTLDSMLLLGEVCYQQGELHQAEQIFKQVLARAENAPMDREQSTIRAGRANLGLGMLALEWNDLETAEQAVSQAVSASQQFPEEDLLADSPVVLAQVRFARGEVEQAQKLLETLIAETTRPLLFRFPRVYQARIALASGDPAAAQRWAMADALPGDEIPKIQLEQQAMVVARLYIEQGKAGEAIHQLESWLAEVHDHGWTRSEIEISILLAIAQAVGGDQKSALETLYQALVLARQEGYRRIFLDEGDRLGAILQDTVSHIQEQSLVAYGRALLYSMAEEQNRKEAAISPDTELLIEPLTDQEQRVLRLLAGGLSNPEIAEELVISINTVKTHVKNIYAKLNVNNRQEAGQAAHHLNLL